MALNLLLSTILALKQNYMNYKKYSGPTKKFAAKFADHERVFESHTRRYPDTYRQLETRKIHFEAEHQLMLDPMPPMLIAHYNELVIQFGWLTFFAPAFPFGPFFCIIACKL